MLARIQKGSSTYVVYDLKGDETIDEVSSFMINNNQGGLLGLAPIRFEAMNGSCTQLLFDVTGRVSLREYIGKNISQLSFKQMITNLIDRLEQMDEYMIDVRQIMLNVDYVYINVLDHSVSFLCIALKDVLQTGDLFQFFRELVENSHVEVTPDEKDFFHCVWNVIRSGTGFSLRNMKTAMADVKVETKVPSADTKAPFVKKPEVIAPPLSADTITVTPQHMPTPQPMPELPPRPEKKKLFGSLFSNGKKKKETQPKGYQGGLASLKNGKPQGAPIQPVVDPAMQPPAPSAAVDTVPVAPMAAPLLQPQQPAQPQFVGTTVLVSAASQPTAMIPAQQSSVPLPPPPKRVAFGGTPAADTNEISLAKAPAMAGAAIRGNAPVTQRVTPAPITQPMPKPAAQPISAPTTQRISEPGTRQFQATATFSKPIPAPATTILNGSSQATTVLGAPPTAKAYFMRMKTKEKIPIYGPVFKIGRERADMDYSVDDNTNIGRIHATILMQKDAFFIVDHNSRNHTYINGSVLPGETKNRLVDGDTIELADEAFEFIIV